MMKKTTLAALGLAALALASCSTDDPATDLPIQGQTITVGIAANEVFTTSFHLSADSQPIATDGEGDEAATWETFEGPAITLRYDFEANTLNMIVDNLKYAADLSPLSFEAKDIPLERVTDEKIRVASTATVAVADGNGAAHALNDVKVWMLRDADRRWENVVVAAFMLSFNLDGKYHIDILPYDNHFYGTTATTTIATGDVYTSTSPAYRLRIAPDRRSATLSVLGARFAEAMPPVNMDFPGISFTPAIKGIMLNCESLTPLSGDAPFDRFRITDLGGTFTYLEGLNLSFTCASTWNVTFSGTLALPAQAQ